MKTNKDHKFICVGKGEWDVYCVKTKGKFSTRAWQRGKVPQDKCRCCGESVR